MYIPPDVYRIENPHIEAAIRVFSRDDAFDPGTGLRHVFICFTNRSGSNYLADALGSGGIVNLSGEYFNGDTIREIVVRHHLPSLSAYLDFLRIQESKNNILVSKIAITQLALLHRYGFLQTLGDRANYVFIKRNDILAQAISTQIAFKTRQWTSLSAPRDEGIALRYSTEDIAMTIDDIAFQNALWIRFFSHNALNPTYVTYERLVKEPGHVLNDVFRDLRLPAIYDLDKVVLRPQTREINRTWRETYRQAMAILCQRP